MIELLEFLSTKQGFHRLSITGGKNILITFELEHFDELLELVKLLKPFDVDVLAWYPTTYREISVRLEASEAKIFNLRCYEAMEKK